MGEGDDWLLRPVLEGMCRYESLKDGTIDLLDIARMNDALDCSHENERRIEAALRKEGTTRWHPKAF